jgi:hypothetical protein
MTLKASSRLALHTLAQHGNNSIYLMLATRAELELDY